jgi:hypothetical protein
MFPSHDHAGQAREQGEANLEAALATSIISNPNTITPYGSQTVTYNDVDGFMQPTVEQTFSPDQQGLYDQQTELSSSLNDTAIGGLGRVNDFMGTGFDTSGFTQVDPLDFSALPETRGIDLDALPDFGSLTGNNLIDVNRVDTGTLAPRTVEGSVGGFDNIYNALMDREQSRFDTRRSNTEADLIARGFNPGGEGFDNRFDEINRAENDFSLGAMMAAGDEQSRLFGLESSGRAQDLYEQNTQQAADQSFRGQQFSEEAAIGSFANQLRSMGMDEQTIAAQIDNARNQQLFNQQLDTQASQGTRRSNDIAEALMTRQLPLNEINALRTGNQSTLPNFQQYTGASVAPPPIFDAALAGGNFAQQNYQNEVAGSGGS